MNLTELQLKHKSAIDWLLNEDFGGKTYLICYCILQKAVNNPNYDIDIINHSPINIKNINEIIQTLCIIMKDIEFKHIKFILNKRNKTVKAYVAS